MSGTLEINSILIHIKGDWKKNPDQHDLVVEGELPILGIPFYLDLTSVDWVQTTTKVAPELTITTAMKATDYKWSLSGVIEWILELPRDNEVLSWEEVLQNALEGLRLAHGSAIYVDDHKWDVVPTLNKIIKDNNVLDADFLRQSLLQVIGKASRKYFNSDLLPNLLDQLYIQIFRGMEEDHRQLSVTLSGDLNHFASPDKFPPYVYVQLPTADLEYFINHFVRPTIEVKGYEVSFVSLEVIGDNKLIVIVKEEKNGWFIKVALTPEVRENNVHLTVDHIDTTGLTILTRVIFNLFKGLLVRQIERRPLPVAKIYDQLIQNLKEKYPFVEIMTEGQLVIKNLNFQTTQTETLVYFEQKNQA